MTVKIDGKEIVIVDCADCANSNLCAINLSHIITLLQRNGITDYKLFIESCKKFTKKGVNDSVNVL